ncbi:hypothetical protein CK500_13995 [Halorubrum salipaludis]|uniref:Uncharacterized protein n=1 Tax=Halorubrum salipaludis TaxID=2032630 RepID=A0A2A2FDR9_9EURY|nr:hypothetical protein [Halorubrum salipaludis]PAU82703.1 hypothetical protein CK500_13995 [Halorubrum salipaludis]
MPRAVLLRCPVCDAVRALDGDRSDWPRGDLYATVESHVRDHSTDETKTAIRKHRAVAESTELVVSRTQLDRLPTERWRDREAATLPESLPADAMPPAAAESPSAETTGPRSRVED